MKIITKKIDDPQYYGPEAINGNAGKLLRYGKYHDKTLEFTIKKTKLSETIYCKAPKWKKFKIISFCWLIGSYDQKGIKKIGLSTLYDSEFLFSFYLHELIELLQQLESTEELNSWYCYLEHSTRK